MGRSIVASDDFPRLACSGVDKLPRRRRANWLVAQSTSRVERYSAERLVEWMLGSFLNLFVFGVENLLLKIKVLLGEAIERSVGIAREAFRELCLFPLFKHVIDNLIKTLFLSVIRLAVRLQCSRAATSRGFANFFVALA